MPGIDPEVMGDAQAGYDDNPAVTAVGQPSKLTDDALYLYVKDNFLKDSAHSEEWREQAQKDEDFVAGEQWELDSYRRMVRDEKRVPITYNQANKMIRLVVGFEINGRHQPVFLPRGTDEGEIVMNNDLNQASKWMGERCKADDEESEAFAQMVKTGMGWVEVRLDFERDPDGMYIEEAVDCRMMYWDRTARGKNLSDAHRIYRVKKMRLEDARAFAQSLGVQNVQDQDLDAGWAIGVDQKAVKPREEIRLKTGPGNAYQEGIFEADPNTEVHIVHVQWWEREVYHRVMHPVTGAEYIVPEEPFQEFLADAKKKNIPIKHARQTRRVYMQAFLGGKVLAKGPIAELSGKRLDRFTLQCMTGELHRSKGIWFGLVRLIRDPQMWSNKLYSQAIHILNTTAKGGIIAEKDAFEDIREAQRNWAKPEGIVIVKEGAIAKNKIMQKPGAGMAAPFIQMMEIADQMMYQTTGINPELLAMNSNDQPGILEAQRKQSGMTILASLFDARKTFIGEIAYIRLFYIQNQLSDGRLMRIVGPRGYQAKRLVRDKVAGEYDVEVQDAPNSPDIKSQTWTALGQLVPILQSHPNAGQLLPIILDASPLPPEVVDKIKQVLAQPNQVQNIKQQVLLQDAQSKIAHRQGQAAQAQAGAARDQASMIEEMAQAILNIAQADHIDAETEKKQIETMLLNMIAGKAGSPVTPMSDQYAVPPQGTNGQGTLPEPPQMPVLGQVVNQKPDLNALLTEYANQQRANRA